MKKGITPVVATILLLIIVIAIVGYSFGFFQRILTTSGTTAESGTSDLTCLIIQSVAIDSMSGTNLYVRNTGSTALSTSSIAIYVNGLSDGCTWASDTINPNEVKLCTLAQACASGSVLKITTAGISTQMTC